METNTQATTDNAQSTKREIGQFGGRYAKAQNDLFEKLQTLFGLDAAKADTIALRFACDFGEMTKKSQVDANIGKVNKKGLATLKESVITKNAAVTFPLKIARAVQWADDAPANFVSYGFTSWRLNDDCQEWVDSL
jgi:hypothetical protein